MKTNQIWPFSSQRKVPSRERPKANRKTPASKWAFSFRKSNGGKEKRDKQEKLSLYVYPSLFVSACVRAWGMSFPGSRLGTPPEDRQGEARGNKRVVLESFIFGSQISKE